MDTGATNDDGHHAQVITCTAFQNADIAGRIGLENIGNTCFMNTGLQCLSHLEPLTAYFLSGLYKREINRTSSWGCRGELAEAFAELQQQLWCSESTVYDPRNLHRKLSGFAPHLFEGFQQQDVQEFLAFCLDGLHEDLNRVLEPPPPTTQEEREEDMLNADEQSEEVAAAWAWLQHLERGKSFLVDLMQGQLRSSLTCSCCGYRSRQFDPFLYLSLPVANDMATVTDSLEKYLEHENLTGDEQWFCKKCNKKVDATKKIDLWKLPPVMILVLKRFEFNALRCRFEKINTLLRSPLTLDLSDYCSSPQLDGASYDIVGVANHVGTANAGHYTAACYVGNQWYKFDDATVRPCSPDVITEKAYVIFLVRESDECENLGNANCPSHHTTRLKRQTISSPQHWPHNLGKRSSFLENAIQKAQEHSPKQNTLASVEFDEAHRLDEDVYICSLPSLANFRQIQALDGNNIAPLVEKQPESACSRCLAGVGAFLRSCCL